MPLVVILGWAVIGNVSRHFEISEERLALGAENRTTIETAASMLESLGSLESLESPESPESPESLEDGLLLAGHSARISFQQLERLSSLGKLPCIVDLDQASVLARRIGLVEPLPVQLACD